MKHVLTAAYLFVGFGVACSLVWKLTDCGHPYLGLSAGILVLFVISGVVSGWYDK